MTTSQLSPRSTRAWTLNEVQSFLKAARDYTDPAGDVQGYGQIPNGAFWHALLLLCHYTGLRISAALRLRRDDIDFDRGSVLIRTEIQNRCADQSIPLPDDLLAILREFTSAPRGELLFATAVTASTLRDHFKAILKASRPA